MITSTDQLLTFVRSNRTLGIVCLAGLIVIGLNTYLWNVATEFSLMRRAYRVLPNAPLVVMTNLGKVLAGVAHIILGWALWRSRRDLAFNDGRRWPSIALAVNSFTCAAAFFADTMTIFIPIFAIRAAVVNVAAWSALSSAVLFPIWLRQYRVDISKEEK